MLPCYFSLSFHQIIIIEFNTFFVISFLKTTLIPFFFKTPFSLKSPYTGQNQCDYDYLPGFYIWCWPLQMNVYWLFETLHKAKAKCCHPSFACSVSPDPEHSDPLTTHAADTTRQQKQVTNTKKDNEGGVQLTDERKKRKKERENDNKN